MPEAGRRAGTGVGVCKLEEGFNPHVNEVDIVFCVTLKKMLHP